MVPSPADAMRARALVPSPEDAMKKKKRKKKKKKEKEKKKSSQRHIVAFLLNRGADCILASVRYVI